jgi:hypothetical protein
MIPTTTDLYTKIPSLMTATTGIGVGVPQGIEGIMNR